MTAPRSTLVVWLAAVLCIAFAAAASAEPTKCKPIKDLPTTIKKRGVYCLTKSFKVKLATGNAIEVTGDDVVIDLQEYTIWNKTAENTAVGVYADQRSNVTVRNGTLVGFEQGVFFRDFLPHKTGIGNLAEDLRVIGALKTGIALYGPGATVRRSQVVGVGPSGVGVFGIGVAGSGARVLECDVSDVAPDAGAAVGIDIRYADGGLVRDNRVHNVSSGNDQNTWGILVSNADGVMVRGNDVSNSDLYGIAYSGATGMYMDNQVYGSEFAFTNGTPAGSTNHEPPPP
jgi:hypothetical protein